MYLEAPPSYLSSSYEKRGNSLTASAREWGRGPCARSRIPRSFFFSLKREQRRPSQLFDCRLPYSVCFGMIDKVSGSDFLKSLKSRARIFKHGSRRLGESRVLPFATPNKEHFLHQLLFLLFVL